MDPAMTAVMWLSPVGRRRRSFRPSPFCPFDETDNVFHDLSHHRQPRKDDELGNEGSRIADEAARALLMRRSVAAPQQGDAHVGKPQHFGQVVVDCQWGLRARAGDGLFEERDRLPACDGGFLAERADVGRRLDCDGNEVGTEGF
ncbi:hypothetical protein [Arthrobacter sp. H5]|uniref:hypothetical protein n=1 Tax=Arthrobacter sp. H5 TaxID=1267973 RepID=UPI0020A6A591|nr:hypothetical protein [Arthrobacter sp. H5]